jgi:hypothetical protein
MAKNVTRSIGKVKALNSRVVQDFCYAVGELGSPAHGRFIRDSFAKLCEVTFYCLGSGALRSLGPGD